MCFDKSALEMEDRSLCFMHCLQFYSDILLLFEMFTPPLFQFSILPCVRWVQRMLINQALQIILCHTVEDAVMGTNTLECLSFLHCCAQSESRYMTGVFMPVL